MALEYLTKDYFTLTSDVWSFGVLFWELLSFGKNPYGHQDYDEVVEKLKKGYRLSCPDEIIHVTDWSPESLFTNVSEMCFRPDPLERASFSKVLTRLEEELSTSEIKRYNDRKNIYHSMYSNIA